MPQSKTPSQLHPCDRAKQTIQTIRTNHPELQPDFYVGIWALLTMGKCGPMPPPA